MKLLILMLGVSFAASCDSSLKVKTSDVASPTEEKNPEEDPELSTERAAKLDAADCVDPHLENVSTQETLTLCDGTLARGQLDLSTVVPENIKTGVSIAGVAGTVAPNTYAECTSNGLTGCITTTAFKSADLSNLDPTHIKSGITLAGVMGSANFELHMNCSSDGEVGCATTSTYKAADFTNLVASNIKNGATVAGVTGSYPSLASPLTGADGAVSDLSSLAATTPAGTYEFFDSVGVRHLGAIADAGTITPGNSNQIYNASLYRGFTVVGDSDLTGGNIKSGINIFGTAGTLSPAPNNCASNSEVGCVTTVTFKAADLSNLSAGNIKNGVVLAGVTGGYPSVTHPLASADGAITDLPAFAATTGGTNYEWFKSDGTRLTDTIEGNESVTPGTSNQTLNVGLYRSVTVAGDANLVASNIKTAVNIFGVTGNVVPAGAPNCTADGDIGCITTASFKSADMTNVQATNIANGIVIAGVTGSYGGAYSNCSTNGEQGCVTTSTYKAANLTNLLAGNIKNGITIAGTVGTYPSLATPLAGATGTSDLTSIAANASAGSYEFFDSAGARYTGSITDAGTVTPGTSNQNFTTSLYRQFTVEGDADLVAANITAGVQIFGVSGTVTPSPNNCTADNQTACVATSTYKSADTSTFAASDLKSGKTVAGVAGSLANCSTDGAQGCVTTATYKSANMTNVTAANIKSGVTIAGQLGDYPSATNPLANSDSTTDLPTFASTTGGTTYEWFQSDGTRITAAVQANQTVTPSTSNQTLNSGLYRSVTVNGDANLVAGKIKKGVTIFSVSGDYPSATNPLAGANAGIADLDTTTFNAKIKSSADFEWFDSVGNPYTHAGEPNITAGLILNGVSIFGTVGTFVPGSMSVSSLTATKGTSKAALSWTRSGGSGVIIVRRAGASVSFTPTHGVNYAQGYTSGSDEVVYRGSAAAVDDTNVVDRTTYYYKAFAYNGDNAYSAASSEASILYTDLELCGGAGESCYDDAAAIAAGTATTPLGKNLEYVTASGSFKVWKEVGTNKILRANGMDEWAMKLNLNGKGLQAAGNEFTDYTSLEGRKCPPSVYIDDSNKISANNCLYYTAGYAAQTLHLAGTTQTTASTIGLNNWSNYNGGGAKWYVGNIKTCSDKGMRLPTVFETATTTTTHANYPSDATPTFAGASNGIPSHASGNTWTASAFIINGDAYWAWSGANVIGLVYYNNYYVRCALP